jgi:hypothetical protein
MPEYEYHYTRFPKLRAYIDRIEARQINFKRFEVREEQAGYHRIKATIKIVDGCKIECKEEEYEPTEQEAAEIEAELKDVKWPRSICASNVEADEFIKSGGQITGTAHMFYDLSRKRVIMIQERRDKDDGGKIYIPWTLFQAGGGGTAWRQMEPDGDLLPFWKPPVNRKKPIMVHEGAKAAAHLDDLINNPERREERKAHPWIEELALYEHWGAPGGALALHHRSDLRELSTEGSLVFACDHDRNGEIAAQHFSKAWKKELTMLRWDERFPVAWDLADRVPESVERIPMWTFAEPATWATKQIGETSHKRPLYALSEVFAEQWVHVTEPELYICVRFPRKVFAQREFDHHCAAFSDKGVRISELLKSAVGGVRTVNYRPDLETGRHTTLDGEKFFNTHVPRKWAPYKRLPDVKPWEDTLDAVFPNPLDRHNVKRFAATLIAKPEEKMEFALLLVSETQGVGKTTFADVLRDILGPFNCTYVSEQQIIGRFTGWMEHRLIICEEIYAGHSAIAYDKLKPLITNKTLPIEKKFLHEYDIDNFAHVIACSNSLKALRLEDTDRRWFVPEVTDRKRSRADWDAFFDWRDHQHGLRKIVAWAYDFVKHNEIVRRGEQAPWTAAKAAVVEAFRSEGMQQAQTVLQFIKMVYDVEGDRERFGMKLDSTKAHIARLIELASRNTPCLFFDVDVIDTIQFKFNGDVRPQHQDKPLAVRQLAKKLGFAVADREHALRLPNWRSVRAHGISTDQATADGAMELLRDKDPNSRTDRVEQLISFSELATDLLGSPTM